jgi:hypothetical protein
MHSEDAANEVEPGFASAAYDLYHRSIRRDSLLAGVGGLLSDVALTLKHRSVWRRDLLMFANYRDTGMSGFLPTSVSPGYAKVNKSRPVVVETGQVYAEGSRDESPGRGRRRGIAPRNSVGPSQRELVLRCQETLCEVYRSVSHP